MECRILYHRKIRLTMLIVSFCALLFSCDLPPWFKDGTGTLVITLPGAAGNTGTAGRSVVLPEELIDKMEYSLDFSGPNGKEISRNFIKDKVVKIDLMEGEWLVSVKAYLSSGSPGYYGPLVGSGSGKTTIKMGQENTVSIPMDGSEIVKPQIFAAQPSPVAPGGTVTLSVEAESLFSEIYSDDPEYKDFENLSYQWYSNAANTNTGGTIISGETNDAYTFSLPNAGTYYFYVEVTNTPYGTGDPVMSPSVVMIVLVTSYFVGAPGEAGGTVFYASTNGFISNGVLCHYLEAATEDLGPVQWGLYGISTGIGEAAIGAGYSNTLALVARLNSNLETGRAAQLAASYTGGSKSDWFLPSNGELVELCRTGVGDAMGMVTTRNYWSSTESSTMDSNTAYVRQPNTDYDYSIPMQNKNASTNMYVRPVRAF